MAASMCVSYQIVPVAGMCKDRISASMGVKMTVLERKQFAPRASLRTGKAAASRARGTCDAGRKTVMVATATAQEPSNSVSNKLDKVDVTFVVPHKVAFGEILKVVGNEPELGSWDIAGGTELKWSPGDIWRATVQLPVKRIDFKCVIKRKGGNLLAWQPTVDCSLDLTSIPELTPGSLVGVELLSWTDTKLDVFVTPGAASSSEVDEISQETLLPMIAELPDPPVEAIEPAENQKVKEVAPKPAVAKAAPVKEVEKPKPVQEEEPSVKAVEVPQPESVDEVTESENPLEKDESLIEVPMGGTMIIQKERLSRSAKDNLVQWLLVAGFAGLVGGSALFYYANFGSPVVDDIVNATKSPSSSAERLAVPKKTLF
eukprot:CAMPEP_0114264862 /NCGR_PEP_ID=MMETSP0058-20121206/23489_1 /TAXON_ID=36894 /ORGANISM="Pyramimonas parkeae, CCMP726" /LENGTH=372 /DNA_ID=CAMNT_0001381677 /DNA_START=26 /DNA_END=1144 /DNA_ORIENTATION=+